jgi:hypothetical protein
MPNRSVTLVKFSAGMNTLGTNHGNACGDCDEDTPTDCHDFSLAWTVTFKNVALSSRRVVQMICAHCSLAGKTQLPFKSLVYLPNSFLQ